MKTKENHNICLYSRSFRNRLICMPAYAVSGDVAGAIEEPGRRHPNRSKTVVDHVVFPAIDLILAVFFFGKLGTAYF